MPPKKKSEQWVETGIPDKPEQAQARVEASRRLRKPRNPMTTVTIRLRTPYAKTVESLAQRFGVTRSQVFARLVEDGIRKYASDVEKRACGLEGPRQQNPFDPIAAVPNNYEPPASVPIYPYVATSAVPFQTPDVYNPTEDDVTGLTGISVAGQPLPFAQPSDYEE